MSAGRILVFLFLFGCRLPGWAADTGITGFLVATHDRGFLGNQENQEIEAVVETFNEDYPGELALIGVGYHGVEDDQPYFTRAIEALRERGVTRVVAIPLFLSQGDPLLQEMMGYASRLAAEEGIEWAASMSH